MFRSLSVTISINIQVGTQMRNNDIVDTFLEMGHSMLYLKECQFFVGAHAIHTTENVTL